MNIEQMTITDFKNLPLLSDKESKDSLIFDSIVILPTQKRHSSSYRCMDFVGVRDNEAICRLSGCSDVLHIDGIGGFGIHKLDFGTSLPKELPIRDWNIDCLAGSGLLRLFSHRYRIQVDRFAVSSYEIFAVER